MLLAHAATAATVSPDLQAIHLLHAIRKAVEVVLVIVFLIGLVLGFVVGRAVGRRR